MIGRVVVPDGTQMRAWISSAPLAMQEAGAFALSPGGEHVLVGEASGSVGVYRLSDGKLVRRLEEEDDCPLGWVEMTSDGRHIISLSVIGDGSVTGASFHGIRIWGVP